MPRVTKAQAEAHRAAITEASARLFRERGLKAVSVAEVMGAAGLTHGGFYGHFESKDALAGAAAAHAFERSTETWRRRVAAHETAAQRRTALVEAYLKSPSIRDLGTSCPTAALCVDVAREPAGAPIRAAYVDGLLPMIDVLAATEATGDAAADRRAALADYATMLGATLMARATAGGPLADEIVDAVRERLLGASATPPTPPAAPRRPARKKA